VQRIRSKREAEEPALLALPIILCAALYDSHLMPIIDALHDLKARALLSSRMHLLKPCR